MRAKEAINGLAAALSTAREALKRVEDATPRMWPALANRQGRD